MMEAYQFESERVLKNSLTYKVLDALVEWRKACREYEKARTTWYTSHDEADWWRVKLHEQVRDGWFTQLGVLGDEYESQLSVDAD